MLPTGTRTVDLDELKTLARQGVVQPATLLETGDRRGQAKNVPALQPIFAELAAQTQAPETPQTFELPNVSSPPEPLVFPSIPEEPRPPFTPQAAKRKRETPVKRRRQGVLTSSSGKKRRRRDELTSRRYFSRALKRSNGRLPPKRKSRR